MNQNNIDISIGHIKDAKGIDLNQYLDISIDRIQNTERKYESLYARYLLDQLIKKKIGISLKSSGFCKDDKGKPILNKVTNYFVSISHSNGLVAVGLGNIEFGIDLEKQIDDEYSFLEVAFESNHWDRIKNNKEEVLNSFCKLEAYSKLLGTGFNLEPKDYKISEDLHFYNEQLVIENTSFHFVCVSFQKSNFTINSVK